MRLSTSAAIGGSVGMSISVCICLLVGDFSAIGAIIGGSIVIASAFTVLRTLERR